MNGSTDSARAQDQVGGAVSGGRQLAEALATRGVYTAELYRVVPEHRAQAEAMAARIVGLEKGGIVNRMRARMLTSKMEKLPRKLEWSDVILNVVTDVGANDILDKYLAGSAYTQTVRMSLKGTGTATAAHTQASHAAWSELGGTNAPAFSGNRPSPSFSSAASRVKSTSSAVSFTFTSGGTVAGCFINNGGSATKDDTTGILVTAGDFSGGNKTVATSDVLNVTYSLTLT